MFARALFAFLVLPGVFAFVLPWILISVDPWRGEGWAWGFVVLGCGLAILLWCVRDFYVSGRGTLAPWDPPRHLVAVGLYRFTRNPMYIGVLTLLGGWGLAFGSPLIGGYWIALAVGFHLRVILHEEPWLAKRFASEWAAYSAAVPRWLPRLSRWRGERKGP